MNEEERKTSLIVFLMILLLGVLAGCGGSVGNEEKTPDTTPEPALYAEFDEPFELEVGYAVTVGRPGILLCLNVATHYPDYTWIGYTLTVDGKTYSGGGACYEDDSHLIQTPFVQHVVRFIDSTEPRKATLMLTENYEVQKPLVLSGNAEDLYVTEKPEYVESERIVMFIDKGIEIPGNILEQTESLMSLVEKETGLRFFNDTGYCTAPSDVRYVIWGQDGFLGVDEEQKKFHIFVVSHDVWWPSSIGESIVLGPEDIRFGTGEGNTAVHELTHAVHQRNGVQMNRVIDEGFATYIEGKICYEDELFTFDYDARENYDAVYVEITPETAEKEFVDAAMNEYDYLYGYWFITYLTDNYGDDIFRKLLETANTEADEYQGEMTKEEMVPIVKKVTSETIFEEFGAWFEETAKDWPRATIYRAGEEVQ